MRILHVIPSVAPRYGGPSTAIGPLTAALRQAGHEVEIATTDADGPQRLTPETLPKELSGVHMFPHVSERTKRSPALNAWLSGNIRRFDVVHTHSVWNSPTASACSEARRAGVPYIIRPCGMYSEYTWQKSWLLKRAYWWAVERANARGAAAFHVTSDGESLEILALKVKGLPKVIPLGLSADAWETPVEPGWLRQQCPLAGELPIVLYLSRLHPKKGITDLLLPALATLKSPAYLAIVGGPDDRAPEYPAEIERTIDTLALRNRVSVLGVVPPGRRWAAFDGADIFVLPSHSENFGLVVPEAMARGKPVIVTTGVQCSLLVAESSGGMVVNPEVEQLAGALDFLLADDDLRKKFGERGRNHLREFLSWERTAESLTKLYEDVRRKESVSRA